MCLVAVRKQRPGREQNQGHKSLGGGFGTSGLHVAFWRCSVLILSGDFNLCWTEHWHSEQFAIPHLQKYCTILTFSSLGPACPLCAWCILLALNRDCKQWSCVDSVFISDKSQPPAFSLCCIPKCSLKVFSQVTSKQNVSLLLKLSQSCVYFYESSHNFISLW